MKRKLAVVTTFSKAGFDQYARRMIDTWLAKWPASVDLILYPDAHVDLPSAPNLRVCMAPIRDKLAFIEKWGNMPTYNGGSPYNYRFDAVKFCHKPFCLADFAARNAANPKPYDGVIWLDADTITHQAVDDRALQQIAPPNVSLQYLGRSYKYTECGYLWFNLQHPEGHKVLNAWVRLYRTGQFRKQREWHDSFLFDLARTATKPHHAKDLTGHIPRRQGGGHPFVNCFLGQYMDHHKGEARKATGKPRKNDLFTDHQAPYWKDHNPHAKS